MLSVPKEILDLAEELSRSQKGQSIGDSSPVGPHAESEDADYDAEVAKWLAKMRVFITHRTALSVLYHRKRERFYSLLDRWAKAASLIAGTAAFSSLLTTADQKAIAGLMVAIATMPGLVFAWNDKARIHAEFAQKFALIEAEIIADGWDELTQEKYALWLSKITTIEAGEPLILFNLLMLCKNQLTLNIYSPDTIYRLSRWEQWTANWLDLPSKNQSKN